MITKIPFRLMSGQHKLPKYVKKLTQGRQYQLLDRWLYHVKFQPSFHYKLKRFFINYLKFEKVSTYGFMAGDNFRKCFARSMKFRISIAEHFHHE